MGRKGVIFGGFGREKGVKKGVFWASKAGEKGYFWRTGGVIGGRRGVFGPESDIMSVIRPRPRTHPGVRLER